MISFNLFCESAQERLEGYIIHKGISSLRECFARGGINEVYFVLKNIYLEHKMNEEILSCLVDLAQTKSRRRFGEEGAKIILFKILEILEETGPERTKEIFSNLHKVGLGEQDQDLVNGVVIAFYNQEASKCPYGYRQPYLDEPRVPVSKLYIKYRLEKIIKDLHLEASKENLFMPLFAIIPPVAIYQYEQISSLIRSLKVEDLMKLKN